MRLLAVHETAEEMVIYPWILFDRATKVNASLDARTDEEDQSKKELTELEKLDLDSAEFASRFKAFRAAVESHAENEEREVFPLLEKSTDETQRKRMAAALTVAEGIAPTHPHKTAPEERHRQPARWPLRVESSTVPVTRSATRSGDRFRECLSTRGCQHAAGGVNEGVVGTSRGWPAPP